ncbi:MAG TPA: VOC family protein [Acidimicrobiales bacterium]|nr:VOC family protein [Acidimicrobiales bacterium]
MLGVWHFSFTVSDLDQAVDFYTGLLGFECIHRQEQDNEYTRRLVGYPDAHLRVAQLVVPGQPRGLSTHDLELVQYLSPIGARGDHNICNPGQAHLALTVEDIAAEHARLTRAGVEFFSQPNRITAGVNEGGATVYFYGFDHLVHELVQPPPSRIEAYRSPAAQPFGQG